MDFVEWLRTRLLAHDYSPGGVDGVFGRNTRNALMTFQRSRMLAQTGVADAKTVEALRKAPYDKPSSGTDDGDAPAKEIHDEFPWMALALRKKGLHEGRNNAELRKFLKSDGKTLGDPAKLPWCGDFVETCIAVTLPNEVVPVNPYLARNWLKFGKAEPTPAYGDVLTFWRGTKSGYSGHVAFYYAEDKTHFHVLGGNQSNSVSVTRIARNRLLGARSPLTGGPYRRMRVHVAASGAVSTNEA